LSTSKNPRTFQRRHRRSVWVVSHGRNEQEFPNHQIGANTGEFPNRSCADKPEFLASSLLCCRFAKSRSVAPSLRSLIRLNVLFLTTICVVAWSGGNRPSCLVLVALR